MIQNIKMLKTIFELFYGKQVSRRKYKKMRKVLREHIDRKNQIIDELREKNKSLLNIAIKQSKKNIELNKSVIKTDDEKVTPEDYVEIVVPETKDNTDDKSSKKKSKKKSKKTTGKKKSKKTSTKKSNKSSKKKSKKKSKKTTGKKKSKKTSTKKKSKKRR